MLRFLKKPHRTTMADEYRTLYENFRWHVPRDFNISKICCLDWSQRLGHAQKEALRWQQANLPDQSLPFGEFGALVCQLSNGLIKLGVIPGDRVIVVMGRPIEALAVMMACWATAAVAVPLAPSENEETLVVKLKQARGRLVFIDQLTAGAALAAIDRCPRIHQVVGFDVHVGNVMSWRGLVARQSNQFQITAALPSAPALMLWPDKSQHLFAAETALILPQQALIGSLPGFVASHNWFPAQATALQTTLMPWVEMGLMAAILPALYFGHSVIFDQTPTLTIAQDASHVSTTPTRWCRWLKTIAPDPQPSTSASAPSALLSVALLGDHLSDKWRALSREQTGLSPNLAVYIPGCGLALGQCNQKWPMTGSNDLLVMPGFKVQTTPNPDLCSASRFDLGFLSIARMDAFGHTNPAQFVQAWPLKASLDGQGLGADALWLESDWLAHALEHQQFEMVGRPSHLVATVQGTLNANQIEQEMLHLPEVWSATTYASPQKSMTLPNTIVILLQVSPQTETQQPNWRQDMGLRVRSSILPFVSSASAQQTKPLLVKIGFIKHLECDHTDQPIRQTWTKRSKLADIDFMPSALLARSPR